MTNPHDALFRSVFGEVANAGPPDGMLALASLLFVAPVGADEDAAVRAIAEFADVIRRAITAPTARAATQALLSYILRATRIAPRRLDVVLQDELGEKAMKKSVSTYDQLLAEGEARGRAAILLRQLRKRFGAAAEPFVERVQAASAEELDAWAERLLDAADVRDVFAG